jgi:hypothetical protein
MINQSEIGNLRLQLWDLQTWTRSQYAYILHEYRSLYTTEAQGAEQYSDTNN